jgi:predicted aldo/keto reductase-like oxidoreductase
MEPLLGGRLGKLPQHLFLQLKARRPQDSVAAWAFRFAGTPTLSLTLLSGMTAMEHLQDNIRSLAPLEPITPDEDKLLKEIAFEYNQYPLVACTDCKYCMPCPYGLDIPGVFSFYNKTVNEGTVPKSSQDANYRAARRQFLIEYDRAVPTLRQSVHCIGCEICLSKCPQHIRIPREMRRIDEFVETLKQGKEFGTEK